MKKRCARFRHISLTRLTYARERIGKSPYIFHLCRFRHMAEHSSDVRMLANKDEDTERSGK